MAKETTTTGIYTPQTAERELPLLPTAIVGSYAMPGWLERIKTDHFAHRISRHDLDEIYDSATKATIKDQEVAGIDLITDGELRRDNMVDYFVERFGGIHIDYRSKRFHYDYYDSSVEAKLPMSSLGLAPDYSFLAANTDHAAKFTITGPHCLSKRVQNKFYKSEEEFATDLARVLNHELRALAEAGCKYIQIDEPYYSGFPEDLEWGVKVINTLVEGVDAHVSVHICYGNRYGKPSWEGSYRYLFPRILDANVQQLTLEFARRGGEDLDLFKEFDAPFDLGLGVIDVKNPDVESPADGGRPHPPGAGYPAAGTDLRAHRLRLRPPVAGRCFRQNEGDGGGRPHRPCGAERPEH